jgi:outer membrane receptor protein involved in Fe transport
VAGASIRLNETGASLNADDDGRFLFQQLEPGVYTITVTREGFFSATERDLVVIAGSVADLVVVLEAEIVELETFAVVAGDLVEEESISALNIRQELGSFADVFDASQFAETGASTAGDALRKVVGTSVVDSRYVVVRGLSDRYNVVLLNGARIPSSDPDRRAVNIDIFPGGLIESLVTAKTLRPWLPGEATGGSIDVILKSIPDEDFYEFSVGTGYNTSATGNNDFIISKGPGMGVFGSSRERELPDNIQALTLDDLPRSGTITPAITENRARAGRAFRGLADTMGVTTGPAPLDFCFSFAAGKRFDFFGGDGGLLAAFTYSKAY